MKQLGFHDYMLMQDIKRWHIVNTIRQQTLADHALCVTVIALELNKRLGELVDPGHLALRAIFHDAAECVTGDVPTPAKKDPILATNLEDIVKSVLPKVPYLNQPKGFTAYPADEIVKFADMIEAIRWLSNNGAGGRAAEIRDRLFEEFQARAMGKYGAIGPVALDLLTELLS